MVRIRTGFWEKSYDFKIRTTFFSYSFFFREPNRDRFQKHNVSAIKKYGFSINWICEYTTTSAIVLKCFTSLRHDWFIFSSAAARRLLSDLNPLIFGATHSHQRWMAAAGLSAPAAAARLGAPWHQLLRELPQSRTEINQPPAWRGRGRYCFFGLKVKSNSRSQGPRRTFLCREKHLKNFRGTTAEARFSRKLWFKLFWDFRGKKTWPNVFLTTRFFKINYP